MLAYYCRKYLAATYPYFIFLTKTGIRPNVLTIASLVPAVSGALFIIKKAYLLAAIFVLISLVLDILDGACARLTSKTSRFGDYLDALVDRYREVIFYFGFAFSGYPLESMAALSGSLLVSFAKARTAISVPIGDRDWPAIGDMADRNAILIIGLIVAAIKPAWLSRYNFLSFVLVGIGLLTHTGCIFRILYAKRIIESK